MTIHFNKSTLAVFLMAAGIGAARAEGAYVGASLGTPDYKSSINGVTGDGSGVGGKAFGGYQLTPNFALEGGFVDLGHIDDGSGRVKVRGAYLDGVGSYEFAPKWSVLGRAGLVQARFKSTNGNDSSPGLKLGAGLQYGLTSQVALRAEYEHYRFSDAFDAKPKVGEFTLGVRVGF
jgi:OmpA-OmpF porin, OOP family